MESDPRIREWQSLMESFQEPAPDAQPRRVVGGDGLVYALEPAPSAPGAPAGNSNSSSDCGVHLDAEARRLRRHVAPAAHVDRLEEVLVQVVGELDRAALERCR